MNKYSLIRVVLRLATTPIPVRSAGRESVRLPINFCTLHGPLDPKNVYLSGLVAAYQTVFGEPPWKETWPEDQVREKVLKDVSTPTSFLTLMFPPEEVGVRPVVGFAWGDVVQVSSLGQRAGSALGIRPATLTGLQHELRCKGVERLLYFDEFAILASWRGGIEAIRGLLRPGLELGHGRDVRAMLFWSTPTSAIVPLAEVVGFEPILRITPGESGEKEVVFLFTTDFWPVLKLAQSVSSHWVRRLFSLTSRIAGRSRKRTRKKR